MTDMTEKEGEKVKKAILAALVVVITLTGCGKVSDAEIYASKRDENKMFMTVYRDLNYSIVVDKDTMVMYSVSTDTYNGGIFTMLVNPDGTPRVWEGRK